MPITKCEFHLMHSDAYSNDGSVFTKSF